MNQELPGPGLPCWTYYYSPILSREKLLNLLRSPNLARPQKILKLIVD
jgi:hypothetical protein